MSKQKGNPNRAATQDLVYRQIVGIPKPVATLDLTTNNGIYHNKFSNS